MPKYKRFKNDNNYQIKLNKQKLNFVPLKHEKKKQQLIKFGPSTEVTLNHSMNYGNQ